METLDELKKYLDDNCITLHSGDEDYYYKQDGTKWVFTYSERESETVLETFESEKELVGYVVDYVSKNKWLGAHVVAWTYSKHEIKAAEKELKKMKIEYERNDIPNYKLGKTAFRIFVFGKDVKLLDEFKKKFFKY